MVLLIENSKPTENLCGVPEDEFETAMEASAGVANVHVSRDDATSPSGESGYSWSVTFISRMGDVPMILVDSVQVGNGQDPFGTVGLNRRHVVKFSKGQLNEFITEPKKATGSVV